MDVIEIFMSVNITESRSLEAFLRSFTYKRNKMSLNIDP